MTCLCGWPQGHPCSCPESQCYKVWESNKQQLEAAYAETKEVRLTLASCNRARAAAEEQVKNLRVLLNAYEAPVLPGGSPPRLPPSHFITVERLEREIIRLAMDNRELMEEKNDLI